MLRLAPQVEYGCAPVRESPSCPPSRIGRCRRIYVHCRHLPKVKPPFFQPVEATSVTRASCMLWEWPHRCRSHYGHKCRRSYEPGGNLPPSIRLILSITTNRYDRNVIDPPLPQYVAQSQAGVSWELRARIPWRVLVRHHTPVTQHVGLRPAYDVWSNLLWLLFSALVRHTSRTACRRASDPQALGP